MTIAPLVWLLVFDAIVGLVWWGLKAVGVTFPGRLEQVMTGLVIVINVVVVIVWLLDMIGWAPGGLANGPFGHR